MKPIDALRHAHYYATQAHRNYYDKQMIGSASLDTISDLNGAAQSLAQGDLKGLAMDLILDKPLEKTSGRLLDLTRILLDVPFKSWGKHVQAYCKDISKTDKRTIEYFWLQLKALLKI